MQESANDRCMQVLVKNDDLNKFTKDHLLNYLENIWDCSLKDLEASTKGTTAVVSFSEAQDLANLQRKCSENPLEKKVLTVQKTFEGGVIMVCSPHPGTKNESFLYYFKNTRRSGGDGSAYLMERDPAHRFLLVHFSNKKVAEKVLQREHVLEDMKLELKAFNPDLDTLPSEEREQTQSSPATSDKECFPKKDLKFTLNSMDDGTLHFESQSQQQSDELLNRNFIRRVEGMHRVYCGIIEVLSDVDLGIFQDVCIKVEAHTLLVEGDSLAAVENIDNLLKNLVRMQTTSNYLDKVGNEFTEWDDVFRRIRADLEGDDYFVLVRDGLDHFGNTTEEFCIKTSNRHISIDQMLDDFLTREDISLTQDEEKELLRTTEWERFIEEDLEEEFEGQVYAVYNEAKSAIMVFAPKNLIRKAKDYVMQFLCNSYMTESMEVTKKEVEFLLVFCQKRLEDLQVQTGADSVLIKFESGQCIISGFRAGVRKAANFLRKFHKEFLCKRKVFCQVGLLDLYVTEEWEGLIQSVSQKNRCIIKDLPDGCISCEDEDSESWGLRLASVVKSYWLPAGCLLHLVDGEVTSMKVDAIFQSLTHRDTDNTGSGTAGCTSHFKEKGARPKTLSVSSSKGSLQNNLQILQSGHLPCKAIIQTVFEGKSSLEDDCLRTLVFDVVMAAQMNHFTTLAIPAIGVDGCNSPMAIHAASQAIVRGIFSYFVQNGWVEQTVDPTQSSRKKNRIAHIFLCSNRPACLRGFEFQLDYQQHPMPQQVVIQPPDPNVNQFVACSDDSFHEQQAGSKTKLHRNTIQVISGDICGVQADAIVVPLNSDLDLSKNKATLSLLHHGGHRLENSLREGNGWPIWNSKEFDKRMEAFENEGILEGSGGSLKSKHVFYLNLPPWGPGASKILQELVEKSLRNADKCSCKSVAFTTLGTGSLGYPPEVVSRTMMGTIADYLEHVPSCLQTAKIVVFHGKNDQGSVLFQEECDAWYHHRVYLQERNYMKPRYPHSPERQQLKEGAWKEQGWACDAGTLHSQHHYHQHGTVKNFQVDSIKLTVKVGNIASEKCDVIVNSTNSELDLTRGSVAKTIAKRCGQKLSAECSKNSVKKQMKKSGLVWTSVSPDLCFKRILHMDREKFIKKPSEMFYHCLERLRDIHSLQSIAFPLIGRGSKKMGDHRMIPAHLVEAVAKLAQKPKKVQDVRLIVSDHQILSETVEIIQKKLKSIRTVQTPSKGRQKKKQGYAVMQGNEKENIPFTNASSCASYAASDQEHQSGHRKAKGTKCQDAVSLFIFSDSENARQSAVDDIQSHLEELLTRRNPCVTGNQFDLPPLVYPNH